MIATPPAVVGTTAFSAFGLAVRASFTIPGLPVARGAAAAGALAVDRVEPGAAAAAFSGARAQPAVAHARQHDGAPWRVERGRSGDLLMAWGDQATFHLDAGASRLACDPAAPAEPGWLRVLLDSALTTAALARGMDALHAAAVAGPRGAIAICAASGAGKTTLAAELRARGHAMVCDDVLALGRDESRSILAHPGPPVAALPASLLEPETASLARFGDEAWVAVPDTAPGPLALAAVVLLDRSPGAPLAVAPHAAPLAGLAAHALDSGRDPERRRRRFELLADVAQRVPVRRLTADPAILPSVLADLLTAA